MPLDLENKRVVLLLQGGGALGAYQVGAFQALDEALDRANNHIEWVGGISIGAINAAVIAAPRKYPHNATKELEELWEEITPPAWPPLDFLKSFEQFPFNPFLHESWIHPIIPKYWNFWTEAAIGQGRFFRPKPIWLAWTSQWFGPEKLRDLSFYDTESMRKTLDEHVDWGRIQEHGEKRERRVLLGATSILDGELRLFDSFDAPLVEHDGSQRFIPVQMNADHVLAAGALPPMFPPVKIDGDGYFDGGVSSNTLVTELRKELTGRDTIVFEINLWDRKARTLPRTMDEVVWRQKCIQYGSRKHAAESVIERHQMKAALQTSGQPSKLEICQVMFESDDDEPQFSFADADFSSETFEKLFAQGQRDMKQMLTHPEPVEIERVRAKGKPAKKKEACGTLYRVGSAHKHRRTDALLAA